MDLAKLSNKPKFSIGGKPIKFKNSPISRAEYIPLFSSIKSDTPTKTANQTDYTDFDEKPIVMVVSKDKPIHRLSAMYELTNVNIENDYIKIGRAHV